VLNSFAHLGKGGFIFMPNHLVRFSVMGAWLAAAIFQLHSAANPDPQTPLPPQAPSQDGNVRRSYHEQPPTGPLPATLDPAQFAGNKTAFVAYSIAAKISKLLYQQPCYCPCDKMEGHQSLLDCYTSQHGVHCHICARGVIFTYEQAKAGKSAPEIRAAMEKGALWEFDREKYVEAHYIEYKQADR
jgi:hypothetical protein